MKQPVRNRVVEQLSRVGSVAWREIDREPSTEAGTYHYHSTVEVVIVRLGWVEGVVGEVVGKLQQGTVLVLGSEVSHCILHASPDCTLWLVHIPCELLGWDKERFPELTHGMEFLRRCKCGVVFTCPEWADKMVRLAGRIARANGFMRMALLMQMVHSLSTVPSGRTLKAAPLRPQGNKEKETAVEKAARYLYAHFHEEVTLHTLAAYAGSNPTALCRAFKRANGTTVMQYCNRLRIEHACRLLLTTTMDMAQAAYASGFNSYPHFCTQFKKLMKVSPTEYRSKGGVYSEISL